jgi:hypothetical protein
MKLSLAYTSPFSRLIALMLGRLRMSVDDAINHYDSFAKTVFSEGKKTVGEGNFKASVLEDVIKNIVKTKTGDADTRMMETSSDAVCKTYVAALPSVFRKLIRSQICMCYGCT